MERCCVEVSADLKSTYWQQIIAQDLFDGHLCPGLSSNLNIGSGFVYKYIIILIQSFPYGLRISVFFTLINNILYGIRL